ncbi:MAG: aminotransferase class III-fold pyridoxal phosphate-dependent enzyme [Phycisphaerae bacterium]|nr:aminotransferase class III-fold pyridoxal phosphate-dependent enzyme [Phycisphaerae bacterium]
MQRRLARLLPQVGSAIAKPAGQSPAGASTATFNAATRTAAAPLSGFGYYRVGEDGRLFFLSKSEHYHAPLGHFFPGYRLVEIARQLGVPNATHNNTRGWITRQLEEELVLAANGLPLGDSTGLSRVLASRRPGVLNRVLNLETGSLAAEAGFKLMLARFFRSEADSPTPRHRGRTPVFIVLADDDGGPTANYHGTTLFTQMLRGMWPELGAAAQSKPLFKFVAVRPNDMAALDAAFAQHSRGRFRVAGFACELVMMNYGARTLTRQFARRAQQLCRRHDAPLMIDEIQTCLWSPQLFMFREYGLSPDIVALGKGFPGGEYPASRVLFSADLDALPQFGALVTNGQEELASLAYLVTMRWAQANAKATALFGEYYEARLRRLAERFPHVLDRVDGRRHMCSLCFGDLGVARKFTRALVARGIDISVQTYKADCPPAALTKLPLIAGPDAVDMVIARIEEALQAL